MKVSFAGKSAILHNLCYRVKKHRLLIIGKTGVNNLFMKAVIKVVTAEKEFTEDQKKILRRVCIVLNEHNLVVALIMKVKKVKELRLRAG